MVQGFDKDYVEGVLNTLEEREFLFPQFGLTKQNNELKLLGSGGFSSVYEMYNRERPQLLCALKVMGFQRHTVSSADFGDTGRIQWILSQESRYIMRVIDTRELILVLDEKDEITDIKDAAKEECEETDKTLHLQFTLMEKLDEVIVKDRFAKVKLRREELNTNSEVLKLAFEIGQALAVAHTNRFLHRDIKLENIFWDPNEQIYKLGDFGIAKWTEDGSAETIVYTDGYGAPEIERRLYDSYNATADIYSLGITLYLLLNDLKFPGSDGYYSKFEVQYNPEFIFPAPAHASEEMARIIRKMCAYHVRNRYQNMGEVLTELSGILDSEEIDNSEELFELADAATETYKEEMSCVTEDDEPEVREKTRTERRKEQKIIDAQYKKISAKYFLGITFLMILLFKGLQPDTEITGNGLFLLLSAMVLIEALLQRIKEFHLVFGVVTVGFLIISAYTLGLTVPHMVLFLCVLTGHPLLALAGGTSTLLWMFIEYSGKLEILDNVYRWHLGWIVLILLLWVLVRYLCMRIRFGQMKI